VGATSPGTIRWTNATARHVGSPAGVPKFGAWRRDSSGRRLRDIGERDVTAVLAHEATARAEINAVDIAAGRIDAIGGFADVSSTCLIRRD
jgi:hypothetical protein